MKRVAHVIIAGCLLFLGTNMTYAEETIMEGKTVQFDYTLTIDEEVVETSEGKQPIEYTHGQGRIVEGLEKALEGMKVGDEKQVVVSAEEGYGVVIEEAIKEIPKANFPEDFEYIVGSVIQLQDPEGNAYPGIVWELKEDAVVVNFNHPLAGKELTFDVKIVSVK